MRPETSRKLKKVVMDDEIKRKLMCKPTFEMRSK